VGEDEGAVDEGLGVLQTGLASGGVADVSNDEMGVNLASFGGELPVLVSSDRVLLQHGLTSYIVGKTCPVRVLVGLVEHGVWGTQEPELGGDRLSGQHPEEATHRRTLRHEAVGSKPLLLRAVANSRLEAGSLNQFPLPTPSIINSICKILWSFSNFGKTFLYLTGRLPFAEVPLQPP
jgi:hypothetical protein